jgi:hypothetical protein
MKYTISIARTETTLYFVEVDADTKTEAKTLAYDKYNDGDYNNSKVVWAEEMTHSIEEVD